MADSLASIGAHSAADTSSLDPIQLHVQVVNNLARCKALILANEPMYLFAIQQLEAAHTALVQLAAMHTGSVH